MATTEPSKQRPDQEQRQETLPQAESTAGISRLSKSPNRRISSPVYSDRPAQSAPQPVPELEELSRENSKAIPHHTVASLSPIGHAAADCDHSKGLEGEIRHSMQLVPTISREDHSGNEHTVTEIISPTPERSMISPSSISRFSKILSINDDLLDLDELANRIKSKDRADSPMRGIMDSRARVVRIEPPWRKRSIQLRDTGTRQDAAEYALVEASDSEDEPELTQGLRQTFCKSDDRPLNDQPRSLPITLPSQLVHRGYPGPLSIKRSPAVRRSTSDLRKVKCPPNAHADPHLGSLEGYPTYLETRQSSPIPLNKYKGFESPRKYSIHEGSIPEIRPPPPLNKELPLLPNERQAVLSLSPPVAQRPPSLPFSLTPLIQIRSEGEATSVAEHETVASSCSDRGEKVHENDETAAPISTTKLGPDRGSKASSRDSRPWNLDTSYPWSDQQPKLEVSMPKPTEDPNRSTRTLPRFMFKVQRASSTTETAGRIDRHPVSSEASSSPFASSQDVIQGAAFRRKRYPTLSITPGQMNSSHNIIQRSPNRTRFVESFETQSPRITLVPPSPGFEARSFFSDDSSQVRPRGTFRKRFSALRIRAPRGASADEPRGYDRGLISSALGRSRASGRSSRQSENTAITAEASSYASQTKGARQKLVNKLRSWWQRGEDRVREWRWKRRYNEATSRSGSADLYAGV